MDVFGGKVENLILKWETQKVCVMKLLHYLLSIVILQINTFVALSLGLALITRNLEKTC